MMVNRIRRWEARNDLTVLELAGMAAGAVAFFVLLWIALVWWFTA